MNYTNFTINALVAANNNQIQQQSKSSSSRSQNFNRKGATNASNLNLIKSPPVVSQATSFVATSPSQMGLVPAQRMQFTSASHQFSVSHLNPQLMRAANQTNWNATPLLSAQSGGQVYNQAQKQAPEAYFTQHARPQRQPILTTANQLIGAPLLTASRPQLDMFSPNVGVTQALTQSQQQQLNLKFGSANPKSASSQQDGRVDLSVAGKEEPQAAKRGHLRRNGIDVALAELDEEEEQETDDEEGRRRMRKTKIPKTVSNQMNESN